MERIKLKGKYAKEVLDYVYGCIEGRIVANEYRVKGCQRFLDDLANPEYEWKPADADFVIGIIQGSIVHKKGEMLDGTPLRGKPFILLPFQKFIIYNLLGIVHKGTIIKKYHEALIYMPRKNGKTSFVAGLAWGLSLLYRRSGSNMYIVANALKQSMESFDFLKYNVQQMKEDEDHGGHFKIMDNSFEHSIGGELGDGSLKITALASNPDSQDSFNCNIAICDEIHAFKRLKQYTLFQQAMKGYSNKLMIGISTAGDLPTGFLANRVKYCKKILDGQVKDDQYYVFICEADLSTDEEGNKFLDYTNEKVLEMANPAYGISIRPNDILNDAMQAQNDPQMRKDFFNKSLNIFTNQVDTYFDLNKVTMSDEKYNWSLKDLAKLPIRWYAGADLSKVSDMTGACLYGRYKDVDIVISHGFIPVSTVNKKINEDNIPVPWWEQQGWLTVCNSEVIEYEDVVNWFVDMRKMGFKFDKVGYDRRFSREFVLKMKSRGFKTEDIPQRFVEKSEAFRMIEKKIITQNFYYVHNKAYEYCISNVKAVEDNDDFVKFMKVMPNQRIDLFDASTIACKLMILENEKKMKAATKAALI